MSYVSHPFIAGTLLHPFLRLGARRSSRSQFAVVLRFPNIFFYGARILRVGSACEVQGVRYLRTEQRLRGITVHGDEDYQSWVDRLDNRRQREIRMG